MSKSIVRELYKTMSNVQTHVVQSSEIATTCLCPYLFKLSYPFGVVRAQRDYGTREITAAKRARTQLLKPPLLIMHDEINLTRRILEPLHRFHQLAADIMLPEGLLPIRTNGSNDTRIGQGM